MLDRKRQVIEAQIASLRLDLETDADDLQASLREGKSQEKALSNQEAAMGRSRKADLVALGAGNGKSISTKGLP